MARLYGVSSGNGNDGVSHMFPNYYVRTDKPWTLAQAAMLAKFKPGKGQAFALDRVEIDGEAEYTISATISDPPNEDTEDGSYPTVYLCDECGEETENDTATPCENPSCPDPEAGCHEKEWGDYEDGRNWSDTNGAWLIIEVFPEDEPRDGALIHDSLEEAFTADLLALCDKD